nr:MAG TPA: hypothetical protein [Caudoviricetes sp.]
MRYRSPNTPLNSFLLLLAVPKMGRLFSYQEGDRY